MKPTYIILILVLIGLIPLWANEDKLVIAHRGASGYLPEHTLEAKALAYGMGADYIEQDLVVSKDNHLIVLHDIHLDAVTDVAERFPKRARDDGRFYVIDFTLDEIKQLRVHERRDPKVGNVVFPGRFPSGKSRFSVATFQEEIELIQGLNKSTGKNVGIYPEIKSPAWHQKEGKDITRLTLEMLWEYGYRNKNDAVFVQCFEPAPLKRIRNELKSQLRLVQLIWTENNEALGIDYERMITPEGMADIAKYANGIGPSLNHFIPGLKDLFGLEKVSLVDLAHQNNLVVHAYTFRTDQLPGMIADIDLMHELFLINIGIDGGFTDFPDRMVEFLRSAKRTNGE